MRHLNFSIYMNHKGFSTFLNLQRQTILEVTLKTTLNISAKLKRDFQAGLQETSWSHWTEMGVFFHQLKVNCWTKQTILLHGVCRFSAKRDTVVQKSSLANPAHIYRPMPIPPEAICQKDQSYSPVSWSLH